MSGGPGYKSPKEAIGGPREKIIFLPCINPASKQDYVCTVDVDPESKTYCKVTLPYINEHQLLA